MPSPPRTCEKGGSGVLNDFSCHSSPIRELESDCRTSSSTRSSMPAVQCTCMGNAIITFFIPFDPAPCDKKCCSEHQTLFLLFEGGVWGRDYTEHSLECNHHDIDAVIHTTYNLFSISGANLDTKTVAKNLASYFVISLVSYTFPLYTHLPAPHSSLSSSTPSWTNTSISWTIFQETWSTKQSVDTDNCSYTPFEPTQFSLL